MMAYISLILTPTHPSPSQVSYSPPLTLISSHLYLCILKIENNKSIGHDILWKHHLFIQIFNKRDCFLFPTTNCKSTHPMRQVYDIVTRVFNS